MKITTNRKHLTAVRKSGNVYDVWYDDHNSFDPNVTWEYVNGLRRQGYSVTVEQSSYRGEGEPETEEFSPLTD